MLENEISNGKKLRKERDAHRLHHKRIAQEKNALMEEIKRLKAQCDAYEPRLSETRRKYEQQLKEKTMISLEKEKLYKQVCQTLSHPLTIPPLVRSLATDGGKE